MGDRMERISVRISQAELPLNPKEQEIKKKVEGIEGQVREAGGVLKEETYSLKHKKTYESKALAGLNVALPGEIRERMQKWYNHVCENG